MKIIVLPQAADEFDDATDYYDQPSTCRGSIIKDVSRVASCLRGSADRSKKNFMKLNIEEEFDRQLRTLIDKGYADAIGIKERTLSDRIRKLRSKLPEDKMTEVDYEGGGIPFVIVINDGKLSQEWMMNQVEREGGKGHVSMFPVKPEDFHSIADVSIPESRAYLVVDLDRGSETINVPPESALLEIQSKNRTPLTIEEGIAVATQHPGFLQKNNCISLLASRRNDQRVPAIWIDSKKMLKLGWCWDRNPHTWLGSASAKIRIS